MFLFLKIRFNEAIFLFKNFTKFFELKNSTQSSFFLGGLDFVRDLYDARL